MIRAEACTDDKYAALDQALEKLYERLRRVGDRRKVSRTGKRVPESVAKATGRVAAEDGRSVDLSAQNGDLAHEGGPFGAVGDSPIEVREKVHSSPPMTLEDALAQMELVGHDFYLFYDTETDKPSVVYRRRGWSYGVIHLEVDRSAQPGAVTPAGADGARSRPLRSRDPGRSSRVAPSVSSSTYVG